MTDNKPLYLPKSVALFGSSIGEITRELASITEQYLHLGKRVCLIETKEREDFKNHLSNLVVNDDITYYSPTEMEFPKAITSLMLMSIPMYQAEVFNTALIHNLLPHFDVFLIDDTPYTLSEFVENNRLKEFIKQFTENDKRIVLAVPQLHFLRVTPEEPMPFDATINIKINGLFDYKHELEKWIEKFGTPILIELCEPNKFVIQGKRLSVTITTKIINSETVFV
ncbi:hypothetical protein [Lysinibacillus fusiformis]|uniref:hypothetical protein n=1 Tax=Lysinibacillus fusiformis TaxID=28031 RepID=UPI0021BF312F|nr:hypothetical protein [Lysinibacillus fusiformis]UXJ71398.1 hypothetical protein N5069_23535 [Lysinibacillus fusiformis]